MLSDEQFVRVAIQLATEKGTDPSRAPIGCVIVMNGNILAACRNKVEEHHDATAHAEIEAIRAAGASFNKDELRGATIYDLTAVRDVHNGVDLVKGWPHCLWCGPRGRTSVVL